jgi:opacity protein-like surface antigen
MFNFLVIVLALISFSAIADTKLGIMGSLVYNTSETDDLNGTSVDENSEVSFGAGVRALMGINDQLFFRSGAGIIQKKWSYEASATGVNGSADYTMLYFAIPATLYWKASPQVGFFGGTSLQAKLSDDCKGSGAFSGSSCDLKKQKSVVLPAVLGFDFALTDQISMELSYEYAIMDTAKDVKVSSGLVSLVYNLPN